MGRRWGASRSTAVVPPARARRAVDAGVEIGERRLVVESWIFGAAVTGAGAAVAVGSVAGMRDLDGRWSRFKQGGGQEPRGWISAMTVEWARGGWRDDPWRAGSPPPSRRGLQRRFFALALASCRRLGGPFFAASCASFAVFFAAAAAASEAIAAVLAAAREGGLRGGQARQVVLRGGELLLVLVDLGLGLGDRPGGGEAPVRGVWRKKLAERGWQRRRGVSACGRAASCAVDGLSA